MKIKKENKIENISKVVNKLVIVVDKLSTEMRSGFKNTKAEIKGLKDETKGLRDETKGLRDETKGLRKEIKDVEKRLEKKIDQKLLVFEKRFENKIDQKNSDLEKRLEIKIDQKNSDLEKRLEIKIDQKIEELAILIAKGFKETAMKKDLDNYVTKEDFNLRINQLEESLQNKIAESKGDLVLIIRKLDEKMFVLIDSLKDHKILNNVEFEKLRKIKAFPTIELKS